MANTRKSGSTESVVDETSRNDNITDGIETSDNTNGTSGSPIRSIVGYIENIDGQRVPLFEGESTYTLIFVGTAGTDRIYRK